MSNPTRAARWLALICLLLLGSVATAHATPKQVVINSPVSGNLTSHPSNHHLSAGWNANWSADIGAGAGQAVYARFGAANGTLSLQIVDTNSQSCANNRGGGSRVTVRATVDGVVVGEVRYLHLSPASIRGPGPIANGTQIGTIIGGLDRDEACWTGPHVHIEGKNLSGATSCYAPGLGGALNGSSRLGVLGGEWTGGQRAQCPEAAFNVTTPPVEPPAPPDGDRDGVPDAADTCPTDPGTFAFGCSEEIVHAGISGPVDANGDGRADYCRRVGVNDGVQSRISCTLSSGTGFAQTVESGVLLWGDFFGRSWTDVNGDGRADYCRAIASRIACTLSNRSGFGRTVESAALDAGYGPGRTWADFNGDGRADYCRRVGVNDGVQSRVSCTLSTGTGFGQTILSDVVQWGANTGRAWTDVNGDGRADYCRVIGSRIACTLSTGSGFGQTIQSASLDAGYGPGRTWTDFNGDGRADYCRRVGQNDGVESRVSCTLSTGTGFGQTVLSNVVQWGAEDGRSWVDFNGDGRADYCRVVASRFMCTLSTGTGFGQTIQSAALDVGYGPGRGWVDFNADGRADYCRRVGVNNLSQSRLSCTLSTGTSFGQTVLSDVVDWGYAEGRAWTGSTPRPPAPQPAPAQPPAAPTSAPPATTPPTTNPGTQVGPLALRSARIRSVATKARGARVTITLRAKVGRSFAGRRVLVQRKVGARWRALTATKVQRNGAVRAKVVLKRGASGLRGVRNGTRISLRLALPKTHAKAGRIGPTRSYRTTWAR